MKPVKYVKYLVYSLTIAAAVLLAACKTTQTQQSSSMPSIPSSSSSSSSPSSSSSSSSSQSSSQSGSSQSGQGSGSQTASSSPSSSRSSQQSGQQSESDILNEALITFDLEKQKSSSRDTSKQSDSSSSSTSQSDESGSPLDNTAAFPGASESTVSAGQTGETSPWDNSAGGASGGQDSAAFDTESGADEQSDSSSSSTSQSSESGSPLDNTAAFPGASESTVSAGQTGETSPWDNSAGGASGGQDSAAFDTESGAEGSEDSAMGSESESYGQESADSGIFDSSSGVATEAAEYGPDSSPGGPGTDAERIIVLESRLDERLAQFDGMILSERQAVIQQDNEEGSTPGISGTGYDGGEGDAETAPLLTATTRGGNVNSGGGMMPSQPGDNRQGDFDNTQTTSSEIPPDIPDGSDDDVVARQLREAAMKETDPKLREKLWDEYRKYKQGRVGKP